MGFHRVSDVFELQMGKTPSRDNPGYWDNGVYNWVSIRDLSCFDKYVGATGEQISESAVSESGIKAVPANTVIMSFKLSLGKTAITVGPTFTNEAIMAFIDRGIYPVNPDYFYYQLSAKDWAHQTNSAVMGATLNKKSLGASVVYVPDLEEQARVVEILDAITHERRSLDRQLASMNQLVKSRFIEMFGDVEHTTIKLEDGVHEMHIGPFGSAMKNDCFCEKDEASCVVYEQRHAIHRAFDSDYRYIGPEKHKELSRFEVGPGDFLVSCRGTVGKVARIPEGCPRGVIHPSLMMIRIDESVFNPTYFLQMITNIMDSLESRAKGNCVKMAVKASELAKMDVPLPPLDMQEDYMALVQQVDKSEFAIRKAIEKLELLKASLMQTYFG